MIPLYYLPLYLINKLLIRRSKFNLVKKFFSFGSFHLHELFEVDVDYLKLVVYIVGRKVLAQGDQTRLVYQDEDVADGGEFGEVVDVSCDDDHG